MKVTIRQRVQLWRLRPGLVLARKLAEQQAWKHQNAPMLGPENNLMRFSRSIGYALLDADQHGKIDGLCLDAVTPIAKTRQRNGKSVSGNDRGGSQS
jgi:hypothetical protein